MIKLYIILSSVVFIVVALTVIIRKFIKSSHLKRDKKELSASVEFYKKERSKADDFNLRANKIKVMDGDQLTEQYEKTLNEIRKAVKQ